MHIGYAAVAIFLPVLIVSIFAFTSVASWADARRREREAFYQSETLKKIAESTAPGAAAALDIIREQARIVERSRVEGQRLGGFVTIAVGLGLAVLLKFLVTDEPVYLVGLIPLLVGVALLVYVAKFAPKE